MQHGEPFVLDAKKLTLAGASQVLALRPEVVGSMLALPSDVRATELRSTRSDTVAATSDKPDGGLVAVMAIDGPLAQRGYVWMCGVIDGYDWITERATKALRDPKVGALVLRINSPGGDAAGCMEAVRRIREVADSEKKKVIAFADEMAASGAYWIAAGAGDEIVVPPLGEVGSIGCIGGWIDATGEAEAEGITVHMFRDPPGKAAGHPYAPVSETADERSQESVSAIAAVFYEAVAERRKGVAGHNKPSRVKTIRGLDAAMFRGQAAVDVGLADAVGSLEEAIDRAAQAAQERKMSDSKAKAALGVSDDATDEQIEKAHLARELGEHVLEVTGADSAAAARGKVSAWKEGHAKVEGLQLRVDELEADGAKAELSAFLLSQVGKKLTPAQAWAKDADDMPVAGEPAERWSKMGLDETKSFVAESPALNLATKHEVDAGTRGDGLTELERQWCRAKGIDPEYWAKSKAKQAKRAKASGKD